MKKILASMYVSCAMIAACPTWAASGYQPYYYVNDAVPSPVISTPREAVVVPSVYVADPIIIPPEAPPAYPTYAAPAPMPESTPRYQAVENETAPTFIQVPAIQPYVYAPPPSREVETRRSRKNNYWDINSFLGTQEGIDIALQISNYHYRQPGLDVSLAGEHGGFDLIGSRKFWGDNFFTAEMRFNLGVVDYSGSGRSSGNVEYLADIRALLGRDFGSKYYSISPYLGIGFRALFDTIDTSLDSYRRLNKLVYFPLGVTQKFRLTPEDRLNIRAEYDYAFYGQQNNYLSDIAGLPDIDNSQHHGSGVRASIMWETPYWSVGPFASYWSVADSDVNTACNGSTCVIGYEPHNNTIEAGLQVKFHMLDF